METAGPWECRWTPMPGSSLKTASDYHLKFDFFQWYKRIPITRAENFNGAYRSVYDDDPFWA
jgi:hypothetical protein